MNAVMNSNQEQRHTKMRGQLSKLDDLLEDVERVQDRVRDKVERQIPKDLNELSAKVDNLKQQLTRRIDQEEDERWGRGGDNAVSRYLAIKELQEAYSRVARGGGGRRGRGDSAGSEMPSTPSSLKREIDECKVAIKKLAESVTTVRNVLDRRLLEEIRKVNMAGVGELTLSSANKRWKRSRPGATPWRSRWRRGRSTPRRDSTRSQPARRIKRLFIA